MILKGTKKLAIANRSRAVLTSCKRHERKSSLT